MPMSLTFNMHLFHAPVHVQIDPDKCKLKVVENTTIFLLLTLNKSNRTFLTLISYIY